MSIRKLVSLLVKLAALGLLVYAARTVDFRGLVRRLGRPLAAPESPASPPGRQEPRAQEPPAVGACVDLNAADRADLERIVHVGGDRSRQIIEQRLVKPFASLDDLLRVPGVGPGTISDIRRQGLACVH
ncbi:MAG: helix-hairpin-helix domain-containing protein [Candidatus Palauibacterales bacterium]|nr:helix-hairpin-helix domain-containing protein [Candidatus Palauibacterales bacterium]MDP2530897.1 helix-hairpin-helix domain-containing protein [Candidatus Palauibacterales bacterium]MDP2582780.1 helix-hairpin-helix domain-containing protein [Candidatus Palauibacterales bacterium]